MLKKRVASLICVMCVFVSMLSRSVSAKVFSDTTNHWAKYQIDRISMINVMNGVDSSHFNPNAGLIRADFVVSIANFYEKVLGKTIPNVTSGSFTDVKSTDYFAKAVYWAKSKNITSGVTTTTFAPRQLITREQAAAMLARFNRNCGVGLSFPSQKSTYSDDSKIMTSLKTDVYLMQQAGIMVGSGGYFNPKNNITRAEIATALYSVYCQRKFKTGIGTASRDPNTIAAINEGNRKYNSLSASEKIAQNAQNNATLASAKVGASLAREHGCVVAADLLSHYLSNTGTKYTNFPVAAMLYERKDTYVDQKYHIDDVLVGTEILTGNYGGSMLTLKSEDGFGTSKSGSGLDWYLALGYYRYFTTCTATRSGSSYTADIRFKLRDYYDWDPNYNGKLDYFGVAPAMLYKLHLAGMAKFFETEGEATITANWVKGKRYDSGANITIEPF